MKHFILCSAALLIAALSFGQSISGTVKDHQRTPLGGATVRLFSTPDSVLLKSATTQDNGRFQLATSGRGEFIVSIEVIGQLPFFKRVRLDSNVQQLELPDLILEPAKAKELGAVVVKSKKPLLEHSIDKTTVNVDAMIGSAASNVLEVLSKTPGVTVDNQGNISLNGKSGILVLVDGRQTYMSAQDLATYLKSLPGATLDKIELIDNPSARYDAAGNAIINLQLKKNRAGGWTGGVSAGYSQGKYGRQNYSLNLNYHSKKINLFSNTGFNEDRNYSEDIYHRRYFNANGDLSSSLMLDNNQRYTGRSVNIMAGMDYQASAKTTLGFVTNLNKGKRTGRFDYFSESFDPNKELTGRGFGNTVSQDRRTNLGLNLNLLHKFAKEGRELSADMNYLRYRTNADQDLVNFLEEQPGSTFPASHFAYDLPSSIRIYTAKADYVQALKNKGRWEAGVKTSFVRNDNTSDYFHKAGTSPVYDPSLSNHFIYDENINAAYLNTLQNWGRFGTQIGLRAEQTNIKGRQMGNAMVTDSNFKRSYMNWFPSVALSYKLDSNGRKVISIMMSRRVNRPNYQSLNPFLFYRDNYSYSGGNPLLNPQIQNRYELKYQHGQLFWAGLSYNDFRGVILPLTNTVDSLFITRPGNYAKGIMVLLNIGVTVSPAKWWNINSTVRLSRIGLRGLVDGEQLSPNTNVLRWEFNNYFTISPKWNAELSSYYASADMNGQNSTSGMFRMNTGLQYKISERGSVRMIVDDIFHSWVYHNRSINLKRADYVQTSESDTQRFGIAFTYRFGKKAAKNRKNNGEEEEKARAQ